MSEHHSDGVGEAVDDILRQALMVAARLAEVAARARQENLTQARARSERDGREAAARLQAEHAAARASLAPVREQSWWAGANPDQIGAAYQTAASWAGQDPDIAKTLQHMNDRLAERGVHVTASMPESVSDLIRAREWVAREDPFMDGAFGREMTKAGTPDERARLNSSLVAAWLASPEGQHPADVRAKEIEQARAWAEQKDPEAFRQWAQSRQFNDTAAADRKMDDDLVSRWKADTQAAAAPKVAALDGQATQLQGAAAREDRTAEGHRTEGDKATARAQDHRDEMPPPAMDGPSAADLAWLNSQDSERDDAEAHHEWDTAERRAEFADSLRGKADHAAVDARVLADVSQGTHPSAAVRSGPRNAPKARKTQPRQSNQLTKGSR
ncbi:hypothetical protein [Paenarthrobacter histidinolovorans]|uniref:Colicin import membrane protein n=1 Tax=Paenarthrobacter histidinolovorans TaxID=43664 RepID=A0ABW8MZG5_9MICC